MDTLAIIKRIDMRIAEIGMSKAEFYEKSGISSASYSQWNTGKYVPSRKKLESAADCLGVDVDYLTSGVLSNKKSPGNEPELIAKNPQEKKVLFLARKADELSQEEQDEIIRHFENTIEVYLKAKKSGNGGAEIEP